MSLFGRDIDPDYVPGVKLGLHSFQIIFSFVAWCLEIALLVDRTASVNSSNGWAFAVTFLSIPAWIYLIMTPRWERTRRFAEPHAMMTVDVVFAILWISAFAAQARYNSDGLCGDLCGASGGIVALGVFAALLWIGSSLVSAFTIQYYAFHGVLPGYPKTSLGRTGAAAAEAHDPDKSAFSTGPDGENDPYSRAGEEESDMMVAQPYDSPYDPVRGQEVIPGPYFHQPQGAPFVEVSRYDDEHPAQRPGFDSRVGTPIGTPIGTPTPASNRYSIARHGSPAAYQDDEEPAHFPSANYNNF